MKVKLNKTLFSLIVFLLFAFSAFAQAIDGTEIAVLLTAEGPGGEVIIGTTIEIRYTEYRNPDGAPFADFTQFGGSSIITASVQDGGGNFDYYTADYTVVAGDLNGDNAQAGVKPDATGATVWEGTDYEVYNVPVSVIAGDLDLHYDEVDGYLRFSPETTSVAGYDDTTPDSLQFFLSLQNWDADFNQINSFEIQFQFEGRNFEYKTFTKGDANVSSDGSGNITAYWDGTNDAGDYLQEGTWGMTLWELADGNDPQNVLIFADSYTISDEHPYAASQLEDGIVILN
ncbi:MAG: hypothetical protein U9N34_10925, partial [Candidatus Cloacimonadota bacterium]|nr:hypothetical protein [Candidatus Cloacimonadota bacterium]